MSPNLYHKIDQMYLWKQFNLDVLSYGVNSLSLSDSWSCQVGGFTSSKEEEKPVKQTSIRFLRFPFYTFDISKGHDRRGWTHKKTPLEQQAHWPREVIYQLSLA